MLQRFVSRWNSVGPFALVGREDTKNLYVLLARSGQSVSTDGRSVNPSLTGSRFAVELTPDETKLNTDGIRVDGSDSRPSPESSVVGSPSVPTYVKVHQSITDRLPFLNE